MGDCSSLGRRFKSCLVDLLQTGMLGLVPILPPGGGATFLISEFPFSSCILSPVLSPCTPLPLSNRLRPPLSLQLRPLYNIGPHCNLYSPPSLYLYLQFSPLSHFWDLQQHLLAYNFHPAPLALSCIHLPPFYAHPSVHKLGPLQLMSSPPLISKKKTGSSIYRRIVKPAHFSGGHIVEAMQSCVIVKRNCRMR